MPAHRVFVSADAINPRSFITQTSRGWGRNWAAARQAASDRPVIVDCWGDSITRGTGAGPGTGSNFWTTWWTDSYVGRLIARLQELHGDGGSGYVPLQLAGPQTGTWTPVAANAGAPYGASTVQATAAASIEVAVRGTEVRIPYMNAGVTGSFRYQIDGGAFTTVVTPSGLGVDPMVSVASGLADTAHTVRIEWVSGTVRLGGIEARRPTGVLRRLFAQGGRNASEFASGAVKHMVCSWATAANATITAPASGPGFTAADIGRYVYSLTAGLPAGAVITAVASATSATIAGTGGAVITANGTSQQVVLSNLPPSVEQAASYVTQDRAANGFGQAGLGSADLVVIGLGVNDAGAPLWSTPERVAEGLAAIVTGYTNKTPSPDFVFVVQHWGSRFDGESDYSAAVGAIHQVAAGCGGVVVDMWALGRHDFEFMNGIGYFADTVHPSPAGHARIADAILSTL